MTATIPGREFALRKAPEIEIMAAIPAVTRVAGIPVAATQAVVIPVVGTRVAAIPVVVIPEADIRAAVAGEIPVQIWKTIRSSSLCFAAPTRLRSM
jgi:hypothetical protein